MLKWTRSCYCKMKSRETHISSANRIWYIGTKYRYQGITIYIVEDTDEICKAHFICHFLTRYFPKIGLVFYFHISLKKYILTKSVFKFCTIYKCWYSINVFYYQIRKKSRKRFSPFSTKSMFPMISCILFDNCQNALTSLTMWIQGIVSTLIIFTFNYTCVKL